jgi:hypothetical protein
VLAYKELVLYAVFELPWHNATLPEIAEGFRAVLSTVTVVVSEFSLKQPCSLTILTQ